MEELEQELPEFVDVIPIGFDPVVGKDSHLYE